jgi:hypothetical protein
MIPTEIAAATAKYGLALLLTDEAVRIEKAEAHTSSPTWKKRRMPA